MDKEGRVKDPGMRGDPVGCLIGLAVVAGALAITTCITVLLVMQVMKWW